MNTFEDLGLSPEILRALGELGIVTPTEIQAKSIPVLKQPAQDFIGLAQTGTGKTAAFGLPLLEAINPKSKHVEALVLAPTRELGQQIAQQLAMFSKYMHKVEVLAVYGGAAISNQIKDLRKNPKIVIATPGRLIDLIERKAINLSNVNYVVLDEADEMLNMGFQEDIDKILSFTSNDKATWLFSATMPNEIKSIVNKYMADPVEVSVNTDQKVNENIEHQYCIVHRSDKFMALKRFLDQSPDMHGIVFCRTKLGTQSLADDLSKSKYPAEALHGDMSQSQRDRVMKRFKDRQLKLLIATDVAARGIDVNDLTHVINHMLPDDITYYTHRSGRTARAGKKGISLSLISNSELKKIKDLEKKLKVSFTKVLVPGVADIQNQKIKQWAEQLAEAPIKKLDKELVDIAYANLGQLSHEDLIRKLISLELGGMENHLDDSRDLNASASKERGDRKKKGKEKRNDFDKNDRSKGRDRKSAKKDKGDMVRFFINIGSIDQVGKRDLIDFICEQGRVDRASVGEVVVHKKHSFFEIENSKAQKARGRFKNLYLDERPIRVNIDSEQS